MKIGNFNINNASIDIRKAVVFTKTYSIFILLFSLFSSGLITGTLTVRNSEYCRYLLSVFSVDGKGFAVIFINLFFPVILTLTLNFIMGLCLVGTPFIYFSSVIEGIYISLGYAYHIYTDGYSNFGRFLLTDIIFFIFIFVIFILSQYTSISTSQSVRKYYCFHKGTINLRDYLLKYAVFLSLCAFAVIIQSFIRTVI